MIRFRWLSPILGIVALCAAYQSTAGDIVVGTVTWYPITGYTSSGTWTTAYRTAACGYLIASGSRVTLPDGRVRICEDTGYIGPYGVDVYGEPDVPASMAPYCWGPALNVCEILVE